MNQISITLNNQEKKNIIQKLAIYEVLNSNNAIDHLFKIDRHTISIYRTNVLLIQGNKAEQIYKVIFDREYKTTDFDQIDIFKNKKELNQYYLSSIGSDEVGVGDFFGGICVCAAYVNKNDIKWLKEIGVKDSKLLSDIQILEIYNIIKKRILFVAYNIDASEYNYLFNKYKNSHIIKSVLHNQCLWDISKSAARPYFVIIDQFAEEKKYKEYLQIANKQMFRVDVFKTQAESSYLAVACASIIARALFVEKMHELSQKVAFELPLGSSNPSIKEIGYQIYKQHGGVFLSNICKNHFKTLKEITGDQ